MPFEWFVALRYLRDAKGQSALILAAVSVGVRRNDARLHRPALVLF